MIVVLNSSKLRSSWMVSFSTLVVFLLISIPIVGCSLWKAYSEDKLFDYMIYTSWVERPEIVIAALFLGRNLCDLIVGLERLMIILHHVFGMSSILMVSILRSFRDSYLGNHCTYIVYMEIGSILFNFYILWPSEFTRNLYFYCMTLSNFMGFFWHWVSGYLGQDNVLHDPRILVTVVIGCLFNFFRQKEAFSLCGCPCWLGGNGFLSPASVISTVYVEEVTKPPAVERKRHTKYAVHSVQGQTLIDSKKK